MRLPALLITFTLLLLLTSTPPGSGHPAPASEQRGPVFVQQLSRPGVGFSWRNVSCPLCKAVFTILDIALLVMFLHTFFLPKRMLVQ